LDQSRRLIQYLAIFRYILLFPESFQFCQPIEVAQTRKFIDTVMSQVDARVKSVIQQVVQAQSISPEVQKIFDKCRSDVVAMMQDEFTWDKLEPIYVRIYQKSFTQSDIDGMISFYKNRTPVDQSTINKMPLVMQSTMGELQKIMGPITRRIQRMQVEATAQLSLKKEKAIDLIFLARCTSLTNEESRFCKCLSPA
jgi:uncharacterized protein